MYHYKSAILVLFAAFFLPFVYSLTDAQKFAGTFNFVNQTLFNQSNNGSPIYGFTTSPPIRGGISYIPAYPGAATGNMSAIWGDTYAPTATPAEVLAHLTAYAGGYVLNEAAKTVTHYPSVGSAVRFVDIAQVRHYEFFENDNLLNLKVIQDDGFLYGTLFWERSVKLPALPRCSASVSLETTSVWVSNGQRHEYVNVRVTNLSSRPSISVVVDVAVHNLVIESSNQFTTVPGSVSQYSAQLYGLVQGQTNTVGQFQFGGSGTYQVQIVSVQC